VNAPSTKTPTGIAEFFATLKDPRVARTQRHPLMSILVMSMLAVICGAEGWDEMAWFASSQRSWLETWLELPNGTPCADTFRRVLSALDPEEFNRCFVAWMAAVSKGMAGKLVAVDGKTMRGSFARKLGKSAVHMVSAWAAENALVLGQLATEEKSNEITAIPQLLALLELTGATVTIDAMGCQRKIAEAIVDKGADYILALKGNQSTLHDEVAEFFAHARQMGFKDTPFTFHETVDGEHGRIEVRRVWASTQVDWMSVRKEWKKLGTLVLVESERTVDGQTSTEQRHYISSHGDLDAEQLGARIRAHWSIENRLHWVLDVVFDEDRCRIRQGHGAENLAWMRKIALAAFRRETSLKKKSVNQKRKTAAWDHDYALRVLLSISAEA
jgi:predicted transposase YbfD/YdcC